MAEILWGFNYKSRKRTSIESGQEGNLEETILFVVLSFSDKHVIWSLRKHTLDFMKKLIEGFTQAVEICSLREELKVHRGLSQQSLSVPEVARFISPKPNDPIWESLRLITACCLREKLDGEF